MRMCNLILGYIRMCVCIYIYICIVNLTGAIVMNMGTDSIFNVYNRVTQIVHEWFRTILHSYWSSYKASNRDSDQNFRIPFALKFMEPLLNRIREKSYLDPSSS